MAAAAVGALVGSRILGLAEQWPTVTAAWNSGHTLALLLSPGGKTIVGGLLGGWIGVEAMKKLTGIRRRTGDLFALPLCVGIAVGRIGCFIAGIADDTYGKPTSLPWAVDLGDGIGRHPVQIYEILFLVLVGILVTRIPVSGLVSGHGFSRAEDSPKESRALAPEGTRFRFFLASYLAWRAFIDFFKPQPLIHGLNLIQWSCLAGIAFLVLDWLRGRGHNEQTAG
jgi:prolipoprotein diacylglyceryltransferase